MFCDNCGSELDFGQRFCPNCGKPIAGAPSLPATQDRGGGHVKLIGIFWLALSAMRLIPAIAILGMFRSRFDCMPPDVPGFVPFLISFMGIVFLAGGVLGLVVGWGLLTWQPWARMAAIVLGCISLLELPFGTAVGVYTLWALLPDAARREYQARSLASAEA
jgi:hypothetical protein